MLDQYVIQWYEDNKQITKVMTGVELLNFTKIAVVNNKDIGNFTVTRVTK